MKRYGTSTYYDYDRGMGLGGLAACGLLAVALGIGWGYLDAVGMRKTEDVQKLQANRRLEQSYSDREQISSLNKLPYARQLGSYSAIGPTPCSYKKFD